jgi:hypothetical protein
LTPRHQPSGNIGGFSREQPGYCQHPDTFPAARCSAELRPLEFD